MSLVEPFSWLVNHFFLIFMVLLGGVIPRVKGSSSLQENLDNFFKQQVDNPVWYVSMSQGIAHIGRFCLLLCPCLEGLVE